MASLADTINKNLSAPQGKKMVRTATGQLVEESTPISQLAGQQGLTAPPTTPGGAAALGASPDSAKMAGTPNQLASAVRQSLDRQQTLQQSQQDKRYRSELTAEEQAQKDKAAQMQATLGSTGAKVSSLVAAEVAKLSSGPTGAAQYQADVAAAQATADAANAAAEEKYKADVAAANDVASKKQAEINNILGTVSSSRNKGVNSESAMIEFENEQNAARAALKQAGLNDKEIEAALGSGAHTVQAARVAAPTKQVAAAVPTDTERYNQEVAAAKREADDINAAAQTKYQQDLAAVDQAYINKVTKAESIIKEIPYAVPYIDLQNINNDNAYGWDEKASRYKGIRDKLRAEGYTDQEIVKMFNTKSHSIQKARVPQPTHVVPRAVAAPISMVSPFTPSDPTKKPAVDAAWAAAIGGSPAERDAAIAELSALTGITNDTAFAEQVNSAITKQIVGGVGQATAEQLANINVSSLVGTGENQLGIEAADLAQLLGITEEQLNRMNISELDEAVNALGQSTNVRDQQSFSGELSAAERGELAEASKEASTTGMAYTDEQVQNLGTQLESADRITFLGKTGTLSELLSDENVSKEVTDLVTSGKWKELPDTDPLKQFISQYEGILKQAGATFSESVSNYKAGQAANTAAGTFGNAQLSNDVLTALLGTDISKATSKVDTSKSPVLGFMNSLPESDAEAMAATLMNLSKDKVVQLNNLSHQELADLDIPDGDKWKKFVAGSRRQEEWAAVPKNDPDAMLKFMTGNKYGLADIRAAGHENDVRRRIGLPTRPGMEQFDGVNLDDVNSVAAFVSKWADSGDVLQAALAGKDPSAPAQEIPAGQPITDQTQRALYDLTYSGKQPTVPADFEKLLAEGTVTMEGLNKLSGPMVDAAKKGIAQYRRSNTRNEMANIKPTNPVSLNSNYFANKKALEKILAYPDKDKYDVTELQNRVNDQKQRLTTFRDMMLLAYPNGADVGDPKKWSPERKKAMEYINKNHKTGNFNVLRKEMTDMGYVPIRDESRVTKWVQGSGGREAFS